MGVYLTASSKIEILDEYNGEEGFFIKTFALNTKRNKNGWRVTWDSIKKRINDFSDNLRPGILYTKCQGSICDLDHTDGATYQASLSAQEPYRYTDIVGNVLDEDTETSYFIHRLTTINKDITAEELEDFKQKIKDGTLQYVSPSVWPISGQYDIKKGEHMPNGEPIIDAYDWLALHDAFVNDPAFGDVARVTAICEGENCPVKLLTAKLAADSLEPLEQIPVMIKHKDKLHFVSVSKKMADDIQSQINFSGKLDAEQLPDIFKNNSFSSCTCSTLRMTPEEALKAKLTASEKDNEDKDEKIKKLESKLTASEKENDEMKAKLKGAIAACAKCGSTEHTSENHTKENAKEPEEGAATAKLSARLKEAESELSKTMVTEMLKARTDAGATVDEIATFTKAFSAKSLAEIKEIYSNESVLLKAATERQAPSEEFHVPFNGVTEGAALNGKTLEQLAGESA